MSWSFVISALKLLLVCRATTVCTRARDQLASSTPHINDRANGHERSWTNERTKKETTSTQFSHPSHAIIISTRDRRVEWTHEWELRKVSEAASIREQRALLVSYGLVADTTKSHFSEEIVKNQFPVIQQSLHCSACSKSQSLISPAQSVADCWALSVFASCLLKLKKKKIKIHNCIWINIANWVHSRPSFSSQRNLSFFLWTKKKTGKVVQFWCLSFLTRKSFCKKKKKVAKKKRKRESENCVKQKRKSLWKTLQFILHLLFETKVKIWTSLKLQALCWS